MRHLGLPRLSAILAAWVVLALLGRASADAGPERYSRGRAEATVGAGLVVGEFPLRKVIDGDTIRVDGLDGALRLIALDAEETFKSAADRRAADADWPRYLRDKRGESPRPVKMATPLGEDAKHFAAGFFSGRRVRLERDDPSELRDRYDRHLVYAFVEKDGRWSNYNVECVRAGMSPYFTKYGRSKRFHAAFVAAEREARAAQRGIWAPGGLHYPDYGERKAWWDARGAFVAGLDAGGIALTQWNATDRLRQGLGREVTVLGTVGDVKDGGRGPTRVRLTGGRHGDLPLIFFDPDVLTRSQLLAWMGELVIVRGVVSEYEYKRSGHRELQIIVRRPEQITRSPVPGLPRRGARVHRDSDEEDD
jgi:endonuclease YncB( thermonuclease family)